MSLAESTIDAYPSRVGREQQVLNRRDPVLWGGASAPGPLSRDQLDQFERDGVLVLEDWLDAGTIDACAQALAKLRRDDAVLASERAVLEPESRALRSLFAVHEGGDAFASLAADDRLAGVARQVLDDDVYVHQSRVNLKPALHGKAFSWHSDFETWHVEDGLPRMRTVSFSVALTANHEWNGPLMLIPGSHQRYVSFGGTTPDDNYKTSLRRQEHGSPDLDALEELFDGEIVTAVGGPGSVVMFDCNTMHGSPNNISPVPRTNAFYVFNAMSNAPVEPFGTDAPRPAHVAERTPRPLR